MGDVWRFNPNTGKVEPISEIERVDPDAPHIITDEIEPTLSMTGTDKIYTSKSQLRKEYKELGFVETGGERNKAQPRAKPDRQAIREAVEKTYYDIKYDRIPISERERERCKQEERAYQNWKLKNGHH